MMDDAQRLALITETVRYCQRVIPLGMPSSCYSKALREPIHFLWERRKNRQKIQVPKFRSKSAVGLSFGKREVIYDHAVPFCCLQEELLQLSPVTPEAVFEILGKYETIVLITPEDERRLRRLDLSSKMPKGWDGKDALARYKAAEIEVVDNDLHIAYDSSSTQSNTGSAMDEIKVEDVGLFFPTWPMLILGTDPGDGTFSFTTVDTPEGSLIPLFSEQLLAERFRDMARPTATIRAYRDAKEFAVFLKACLDEHIADGVALDIEVGAKRRFVLFVDLCRQIRGSDE